MQRTRDNEQQIVSTTASFPFVVQITHNGETTEIASSLTRDMRHQFSRAIPDDAEWCVLPSEGGDAA